MKNKLISYTFQQHKNAPFHTGKGAFCLLFVGYNSLAENRSRYSTSFSLHPLSFLFLTEQDLCESEIVA